MYVYLLCKVFFLLLKQKLKRDNLQQVKQKIKQKKLNGLDYFKNYKENFTKKYFLSFQLILICVYDKCLWVWVCVFVYVYLCV